MHWNSDNKGGVNLFNRNIELKKEKGNIPYWILGEKLGLSENTIVRWFRQEMDTQKKERVLQAIKEVKQELKSTEK